MTIEQKTKAIAQIRAMLCFMSISALFQRSGISVTTIKRTSIGGIPQDKIAERIGVAWDEFINEQRERRENNHGS
jgi:hypothetical protein